MYEEMLKRKCFNYNLFSTKKGASPDAFFLIRNYVNLESLQYALLFLFPQHCTHGQNPKFFGWFVQKDYGLHLSFLQNFYQFCLRKAPKHQLNRN